MNGHDDRPTAQLLVGPMLRYVSDTEATIWVETDEPCTVTVLDTSARTFTVWGHHYALVVIQGLTPGTTTPYTVELDGQTRWPERDSPLPPSVIRTRDGDRTVQMLFGSCRSAAPHRPPFTLRPDQDDRGRGVDAFRAIASTMAGQDPSEWPDVVVLVGDQVYADDISPDAATRVAADRRRRPERPDGLVADFEEYTWLYHESWTPDLERWAFSVLPSVMIFDDHDMIDDWNISGAWVEDIRRRPWWAEHVVGGLVSYWIYQHLGNLSPAQIRDEGMLAAIEATGDGGDLLRQWAERSEEFTPVPGGYHFSYSRNLGPVHLVVMDCRNGRVLRNGDRAMLDHDEWRFVTEESRRECTHLVLAASLPVFVPGGLHGIQQWNEAVCDGVWGRAMAAAGERIRRALDMEDWPAFDRSYRAIEQLILGRGRHGEARAPATISVLSGDIHFSYVASVRARSGGPLDSAVHQLVSSPIRNVLGRRDRRVLRFAVSRPGELVGRALQRLVRRGASALAWDLVNEPIFGNSMGLVEFRGPEATLTIVTAGLGEEENPSLQVALERDLTRNDPAPEALTDPGRPDAQVHPPVGR